MILLNSDIPAELLREANDQLWIFIDLQLDLIKDDGNTHLYSYFFERIVYENPDRCWTVLYELSEWARDDWEHHLGYLHEYALDRILSIACDLWDDDSEQENKELVYGNPSNDDEDFDLEDYSTSEYFRQNLENPKLYLEECFEDADFISAEDRYRGLYEEGVLHQYALSDDDLYFLPRDIRAQYLKELKHYEFKHLMGSIISYLRSMLIYNNADKLLLNDDKTLRSESTAHILIEAILKPFCIINDLDLTREAISGKGLIDFKISRGNRAVILEIKKFNGSIAPIINALNYQLPAYMKAQSIRSGILVVLSFCEDNGKLSELQQKASSLGARGIELEIIDLHKPRISPSRLRG